VTATRRWSIVVPMWNESARIEATVATLADAFADDDVELIFVDDGSDDGTADIVERACKEAGLDADVLRLTENRGKGAAVRAGLLAAGGVVPPLFGPLVAAGFAFDVEVLARADRLGMVVTEVPIVWHHVEGSRLSPLRDGVKTFREAWRVRRVLNSERVRR